MFRLSGNGVKHFCFANMASILPKTHGLDKITCNTPVFDVYLITHPNSMRNAVDAALPTADSKKSLCGKINGVSRIGPLPIRLAGAAS